MTMCTNPTNTAPGTFNTGYSGVTPGYPTGNPSMQFTQYPTTNLPQMTPQWQPTPWNTAAAYNFPQPTWPGAYTPTPGFGFTPWANTFAYNPTPWTNSWNSTQPWNPWTTAPSGWSNNPFTTVQANWQTPWTPFANTIPANFTPTGYTNTTTNPWAAIAATLNTLSQASTWSPQLAYPGTAPFTGFFNSTPWSGGFPTFGNTGAFATSPTPFATTPWTNGFPTFGTTIPTAPAPTFGWPTPFFFNAFNTPSPVTTPTFGFYPAAVAPTTTPWPMPTSFGAFNPNTPGPFAPAGFTPTTPGNPLQPTRTTIQNGDTTYRNAA